MSSNAIHFLPILVATSHIHLAMLRERLEHGSVLYGDNNTNQWKKDLLATYKEYMQAFSNKYKEWKIYRKGQIHVQTYSEKNDPFLFLWDHGYDSYSYAKDHLTGEEVKLKKAECNSDWTSSCRFHAHKNAAKERMFNAANADMIINIMSETFLLKKLYINSAALPVVDPDMAQIIMGPYASYTIAKNYQGYKRDRNFGPYIADYISASRSSSRINKVHIRGGNVVDGLQFFYDNGDSTVLVGSPGGGTYNTELNSDQHLTGMKLLFRAGPPNSANVMRDSLLAVALHYVDGDEHEHTTRNYGNDLNWDGVEADVKVKLPYHMIGGMFQCGKVNIPGNDDYEKVIKVVKLIFEHKTPYASSIE